MSRLPYAVRARLVDGSTVRPPERFATFAEADFVAARLMVDYLALCKPARVRSVSVIDTRLCRDERAA